MPKQVPGSSLVHVGCSAAVLLEPTKAASSIHPRTHLPRHQLSTSPPSIHPSPPVSDSGLTSQAGDPDLQTETTKSTRCVESRATVYQWGRQNMLTNDLPASHSYTNRHHWEQGDCDQRGEAETPNLTMNVNHTVGARKACHLVYFAPERNSVQEYRRKDRRKCSLLTL